MQIDGRQKTLQLSPVKTELDIIGLANFRFCRPYVSIETFGTHYASGLKPQLHLGRSPRVLKHRLSGSANVLRRPVELTAS
jgi:hypothetical protein